MINIIENLSQFVRREKSKLLEWIWTQAKTYSRVIGSANWAAETSLMSWTTIFTHVWVELVYQLTPPFSRLKIVFSSYLVKEVEFRLIEISQKINLLFLRMYWKHGKLINCSAKCNCVLLSSSALVYITMI